MQLVEWIRLETFMGLAAVITVLTQIIKAMPFEATSDYPRSVAWTVTAAVICGIGFVEGADPSTIATIGVAVGFAAMGLYDVSIKTWAIIKALVAKLSRK